MHNHTLNLDSFITIKLYLTPIIPLPTQEWAILL